MVRAAGAVTFQGENIFVGLVALALLPLLGLRIVRGLRDGILPLYRTRIAREAEYKAKFANPFVAAAKGFIDEVIYPHSTRRRIALGLRKLRDKQLENPWKKHDNIPL